MSQEREHWIDRPLDALASTVYVPPRYQRRWMGVPRVWESPLPTGLSNREFKQLGSWRYHILRRRFNTAISERCDICLENYDATDRVTQMHCTHHFHTLCLKKWLKRTPSCPMCRGYPQARMITALSSGAPLAPLTTGVTSPRSPPRSSTHTTSRANLPRSSTRTSPTSSSSRAMTSRDISSRRSWRALAPRSSREFPSVTDTSTPQGPRARMSRDTPQRDSPPLRARSTSSTSHGRIGFRRDRSRSPLGGTPSHNAPSVRRWAEDDRDAYRHIDIINGREVRRFE